VTGRGERGDQSSEKGLALKKVCRKGGKKLPTEENLQKKKKKKALGKKPLGRGPGPKIKN